MKRIAAIFCVFVCFLGIFVHFSPATTAASSTGTIWVDRQPKSVSALKVGGNHYFKLRDVAAALSGTDKAFNVSWSDPKQQISILPGQDYVPGTAENEPAPDFSRAEYTRASVDFQGDTCTVSAYNVQNHYYFKLRDVLKLLDVGTFWDERREQVHIDTSYAYIEEGYLFQPKGNTVILMYHDFVDAAAPEAGHEGEVTTAAKFEQDLRALLDTGYKPISLEDLYLGKAKANEKYFVVTCDDGYLSNYTLAYPIAKKLKVPMDIFINTDNIQLSHHFSLAQGAEMEASGLVKIYSHYPQHVPLTSVDPSQIRDEIWRSQDTLENGLNPKRLYFFAYPHGAYNYEAYKQVNRSGAAMQLAQTANPKLPHLLTRVNVSFDSDILALAAKAYKN